MSILLSLETSTKMCSVALHKDGILLSYSSFMLEKSHSKVIIPLIDNILKDASLKREEIQAVAVAKGPGSYTGLRIGVSTAKGLCYALDIPLIGVSTLEAMAFEVNKYNYTRSHLCPMVDARRMEVYCAVYNNDNKEVEPVSASVIDAESFKVLLEKKEVIFFGDGSSKCRKVITSKNARFLDQIYPSALGIGALATNAYNQGRFEDLAYFEPFYLKDFMSI